MLTDRWAGEREGEEDTKRGEEGEGREGGEEACVECYAFISSVL